MHELSVTENILEISLKHAAQAQAVTITDIYLVIGQLSSFMDEAIQMYWDIISEGTIAVGATLHFRRVPAEVRCQICQTIYSINTPDFICPECTSVQGVIIKGDELYVEAIEVIEEEEYDKTTYSSD